MSIPVASGRESGKSAKKRLAWGIGGVTRDKFALVVPHCGEGSSLVFDIGAPEGSAGVIQLGRVWFWRSNRVARSNSVDSVGLGCIGEGAAGDARPLQFALGHARVQPTIPLNVGVAGAIQSGNVRVPHASGSVSGAPTREC